MVRTVVFKQAFLVALHFTKFVQLTRISSNTLYKMSLTDDTALHSWQNIFLPFWPFYLPKVKGFLYQWISKSEFFPKKFKYCNTWGPILVWQVCLGQITLDFRDIKKTNRRKSRIREKRLDNAPFHLIKPQPSFILSLDAF